MPTDVAPPQEKVPTQAAPTGKLPEALPAEEFGLTDALDPWIEQFAERTGIDLSGALAAVDRRATVRVTSEAIEVRGVVRSRTVRLDHVRGLEVTKPVAVLGNVVPFWQSLLWLVPGARLGKAVRIASSVAPRLRGEPQQVDVDELDRPVVSSIGKVGPRLRLRGAAALVALVHPRLTQRLLEEAERRSIPVTAKA